MILRIFGLYTKKEYMEGIKIYKAYGYQAGRLKERRKTADTIAAMQIQVDHSKSELNELKLDFEELKKYKLGLLNKEISELEALKKRVKSYRKKKKINSRIVKLRLRVLDIMDIKGA